MKRLEPNPPPSPSRAAPPPPATLPPATPPPAPSPSSRTPSARIIGAGRAGRALQRALTEAGWSVDGPHGRDQDDAGRAAAAEQVDLLVLAARDAEVAGVAARVRAVPTTTVAHLSGILDLDALAPHPRRASIHPLVSLPDAETGAARLAGGAWFALSSSDGEADRVVRSVVAALGGHAFRVPEDRRALYHAAAAVAANHLVALLAQAQRVGAEAEVPAEALVALARSALDNVAALGPQRALTGPVARGDWDTVAAHLAALAPGERRAYRALAAEAARLAGVDPPAWLSR